MIIGTERGYQHSRDITGKCSMHGQRAQREFALSMQQYGFNVIISNLKQDRDEHFDLIISGGNFQFKVDVKSIKFLSRNSEEKVHYLELNQRKNRGGWIYGSHADFIAFELEKTFALWNRNNLADFCDWYYGNSRIELVGDKSNYPSLQKRKEVLLNKQALYCRDGDVIAMVSLDFISHWCPWQYAKFGGLN